MHTGFLFGISGEGCTTLSRVKAIKLHTLNVRIVNEFFLNKAVIFFKKICKNQLHSKSTSVFKENLCLCE